MIETVTLKTILEVCKALLVYPYEVATTPILAHSTDTQIVIWDGSPSCLKLLNIDARLIGRQSIEDFIKMKLSEWNIPHR